MHPDPFPEPGPDNGEPAGSPLPPADQGTAPDGDREGPAEQGLYVCLPAEQANLAGFAQHGEADIMAPARCWPPSCTPSPGKMAPGWPGAPMIS